MSDESVFGLPGEAPEDNPLFADPALETPEVQEEAPEAPSVEEPTVPEVEAPAPVVELALETPETPEPEPEPEPEEVATPKLWAGKYTTPEELEKGYRERSEMQRRATERAGQFEAQQTQISQRAQEMQEALRKAVPYIQQLQAENQALKQRPQLDQYGNAVEQPVQPQPQFDPRQVQAYIEAQTQSEVARLRQDMEAQNQTARVNEERKASIMGFYEKHPEVEIHSSMDADLKETIQEWSDAWGEWEPDIANPDVLEIALEATKDPALRSVLRKNSAYIEDEDGMKLARFEAAILRGEPITQTVAQVPASVVGTRKPVVEKASTTSPSGSQNAPYDPWKEVVEEHRKSESSSFGGSVF